MAQRNTKKTREECQNEIWQRFPHINIISEYKGANEKVTLQCTKCGHKWETTARSVVVSKRGCPKCGVKDAQLEKSKEYFLKRFAETNGDNFELLEFTDCMHVKVKCKTCGTIRETNANNIYRFGCKHCEMIAHGDKTRSSTEAFIKKAQFVHGNKYDYSNVNYINRKTTVEIICRKHGAFNQTPNHHLQGEGCPKCRLQKISDAKRLTTKDFIEKSTRIHSNKYDYSKVNYIVNRIPVTIICPKHGEFSQRPDDHLHGSGCQLCAKENSIQIQSRTTDEFIKLAEKKHQGKYDYSGLIYVNARTPVDIRCREHGMFSMLPYSHLYGGQCPYCTGSKLNTELFIQRAKDVHGDKYDYSKTNYIYSKELVTITCRKHGDFEQIAREHLKGAGCPKM